MKKSLISIIGPTAVGKTEMAISIAEWLNTEIISADSRQFYRELEIGTAKPTKDERLRIRHHFVDSLSINDSYDVGRFERDSLAILKELFKDKDAVLLAGGSGLFCKAVWEGLDTFPDVPETIRKEVIKVLEEHGIVALQQELKAKDPVYFDQVDKKNPQRLVRALEVIRSSGRPFSAFHSKSSKTRSFKNIKIGLELPRETLYDRIDHRMDAMIERGLFEEAEIFFEKRHLNALQTVGYSEIFGFLEGKYDKVEAVRLLKRNSRRYAKRQLTWFRRDAEIRWFVPTQLKSVKDLIERELNLS